MARLRSNSSDEELLKTSSVRSHPSSRESSRTEPRSAIHARDHTLEDVENHETGKALESMLGKASNSRRETSSLIKKRVVLSNRQDNPLLKPFEDFKPKRMKVPSLSCEESTSTSCTKYSPSGIPREGYEDLHNKTIKDTQKMRSLSRRIKHKPIVVQDKELFSDTDSESDESDNMSDFIVNDSSDIEESSSPITSPLPLPKSTRKLVRGRRPNRHMDDSEDEILPRKVSTPQHNVVDEDDLQDLENSMAILTLYVPPVKDIDRVLTRYSSPSEPGLNRPAKGTTFTTPPPSPTKSKSRLVSPKKVASRIPATPHHQHHDDFWQIDIVNKWNDEYSPQKPLNISSPEKLNMPKSPSKVSPTKRSKFEMEAKRTFAAQKHELATQFLKELDERVTNNKITELSKATGGTKIVWSKTLQTTAGRANWKRVAVPSRERTTPPIYHHHATIELAEKVIDDENRLLNVVAHEFCHLANFMISNVKTQPHGVSFQAWGAKCSQAFADRGVVVTTKHSYEIEYKYIWTCVNEWCGQEFKRQSKSIDPARHACGSCKSKLIQTKPVPRNKQSSGTTTGNGLSAYQLFVKENMGMIRKESPSKSQKEIMIEVGRRYQLAKLGKDDEDGIEKKVVGQSIEKDSKTIEDELDVVSRRLNFVDLTTD